MRGVARGLAPIRDAYSGGIAYDRETLDVHRRQLHAMERRDHGRAGGGSRRALPHARDAVREGHRPALVGPVRRGDVRAREGLAKQALCPRGAPDRRDAASRYESISPDMHAPCVLASRRPAAPGRAVRQPPRTAPARSRRSARTRRPPSSTSPRSSPSTWSGSGSSQRIATRSTSWRTIIRVPRPRPAQQLEPEPGEIASADRRRRHDVDAEVERRSARDPDPDAAGVGVRVAVRDERERRSAVAVHLERVREAAATRREQPQRLADEGRVARASPVLASTPRVDPPDELGVEPDPRVEGEAAPVDAAEADPARRARREALRRSNGIARGTERAGSTLVPPPGMNPSGTSPPTPFRTSL